MMISHITRVFISETAIVGDPDGLEYVSLDEESQLVGPPGRYNLMGYLVPVSQLPQYGIPELVTSPAAMIIGLSTHERAALLRRAGGMWELLLSTASGTPEQYLFREQPEPRPVAKAPRRRQQAVW